MFEEAEQQGHRHLTVEQIGERLQAAGCSINRSTIYRNIDWMVAASILQANRLLGEGTTYELAAPTAGDGPHVHLVCRRCLSVQHGEIDASAAPPVETPEFHQFHQIATTVTITGYCAACWQELVE